MHSHAKDGTRGTHMREEAAVLLNESTTIGIEGTQRYIPHRYPMLLIDRLVDVNVPESAVGIKNVTLNEWFFQGHFPARPIMPGVLIVEAMAQTAGVLVMRSMENESPNKIVYFMTIEEARFRRPVVPGDVLVMPVEKVRCRGNVWKFSGVAKVDDVIVAEAIFSAMIVDG